MRECGRTVSLFVLQVDVRAILNDAHGDMPDLVRFYL